MSEEQFKIWKQVEAKGLEKLEKVEKALTSTEKEGFEEAHNLNTKHWKRRYILVVFNVVYKSGRRGNSWILDVGAKNGREEKRRICISRNRR